MAKESREVVDQTAEEEGALVSASAVPDFMPKDDIRGTESLDAGDMEIPRVYLLQALNPETQLGFRVGQWFHNILEGELGNEIRIIPILARRRYVLWRPRHSGGGILARSEDGVHWIPPNGAFKVKPVKGDDSYEVTWQTKPTVAESRLADWGTSAPRDPNSPPAATKNIQVIACCPDRLDLGPFALIFQRKALGPAQKLMQKIRLAKVPSFGQIFKMSGRYVDEGPEEKYWQPVFTADGFVPTQELYQEMEACYTNFSSLETIAVKDEEGADISGAPESGPATGDRGPEEY